MSRHHKTWKILTLHTTSLQFNVLTSVYCMYFLASQPGVCVLDPMCGVGTILIEAAQEHPVRPEIYAAFMSFWHKKA